MNNFQIFIHPEFGEVRTMLRGENDEPWFVGTDVATMLGYKNPHRALDMHVQPEDANCLSFRNSNKTEELNFLWKGNDRTNKIIINESGLYSLIFASKLDKAREFKHWVTSEVLPQIRRTGGFIHIDDDESDDSIRQRMEALFHRTLQERDRRIEQQQQYIQSMSHQFERQEAQLLEQRQVVAHQKRQLRIQAPMVIFATAVTCDNDSIDLGTLAKLLTQNGVTVGRQRLFGWLRRNHYIFQEGRQPIQRWVEAGIFSIDEKVISRGSERHKYVTTRVTGRGQRYFIEGFLSGTLML